MSESTHYRICPLCEACCGLEIQVQDGRVLRIRGHDADVFSAGYVCPKAVALRDLHEDPDRLRQPLIRRNGVHQPATWDEAFAEIERRLPPIIASQGRHAVALAVGNPAAHKIGLLLYFAKLARALGSRNVFSASTLDQMPKQLASGLMFGHWLSVALPDIARTDLLLVIGANPLASNGSMWTVPDFRGKAKALQARGGKPIVIDPRRTETAAVADEHHFIRPNADVFFLAALVHTLFAEGLVRLGRLEGLANGVEEVRAAVAPFTPEAAAARCGMAADTIRNLARRLATTERAAVYGRIGTCTQEYGTLASWLIDVLNALTGHMDQEGGLLFAKAAAFAANTTGKPGIGKGVATGRHRSRVSGAPEVFGTLVIAPRLPALLGDNPELSLDLLLLPRFANLANREADIGVTLDPPETGRYVVSRLAPVRYYLYGTRAYLEGRPPIRSRGDLSRHTFVGYVEDWMLSSGLNFLDELGVVPERRFCCTGMLAQYQAAIAGVGLVMMPPYAAAADRRLRPVLADSLFAERCFWLVAPADLFRLRRVRAVWDFLRGVAEREPGLFVR